MDYHIEISSIVQFVNDQLRQKTIVKYNAREIYTHIKKAVLDSETKPFLNPPHKGEYDSNYEKYARINAEWDDLQTWIANRSGTKINHITYANSSKFRCDAGQKKNVVDGTK